MEDTPSPAQLPPRRSRPFVAAIGSGAAFFLAFPPVDQGTLGWFALAPFFSLARSDARAWRVYLAAWAGGLVFGMLSLSWVAAADVGGAFWMGLYMSLWWPLALLPARLAVRRGRVPLIVAGPVAWVGMEYLRAHVVSGFPWYHVGHTQHAYLIAIQMCDVFGTWGLSLLMVAANVLWLDLLSLPLLRPGSTPRLVPSQKWKTAAVLGLVAASWIYGGIRLATANHRPGPRVALLQSDFLQGLKNENRAAEMLARMDALVFKALEPSTRPDLLVWPETTYPPGLVEFDPALTERDFARLAAEHDDRSTPHDWRTRRLRIQNELHGMADDAGVPIVVGATAYDFRPGVLERFNSAALFAPGRTEVLRYDKRALVPVGEYFPFLDLFPWLIALTPYEEGYVPSLTHGRSAVAMTSRGVRYAPIICFEDTLPHVARSSAIQSPRPDVLLNLTNDGWFRGTAEPRTHLFISIFRCVELRVPMARAVNTGISAVIDGDGRVRESLPVERESVLTAEVPLDGRFSLYRVVGDALGLACLVATLGMIPFATFSPRHLTPLAQPRSVG